jgi:RNA polymerase sigma-70 factor (ECF subfamily)
MGESDEELMLRAGTGDRDACEKLVARHLDRIVRLATIALGNRDDGEEAAQETFLRVWAAAPRWKHEEARFTTWLHRVVVNVCLDRMARQRTKPGEPLTEEPRDPRPGPGASVARSQRAERVRGELASLTESQRLAVALCYFQGFSNEEAAASLAVSIDAVESLLSRARRSLRERLRHVLPELAGTAGRARRGAQGD